MPRCKLKKNQLKSKFIPISNLEAELIDFVSFIESSFVSSYIILTKTLNQHSFSNITNTILYSNLFGINHNQFEKYKKRHSRIID